MLQVKCNCQKCLHFNDEIIKVVANFACMPAYRLLTALICDENCNIIKIKRIIQICIYKMIHKC
jgi:hypothetical protein